MKYMSKQPNQMSMKKIIILVFIVLSVVACQNPAQQLSDQDISAIRSTLDKYVSTALAADWDAWGNTIASDGIFFPPNQEPLEGREAIVAWGRTLPKLTSFTISATEISGYKDIAYVFGPYSLSATLDDQGSHIDILRKQPDGTWLYSRAICHSNLPLPTVPPAK